jgi:hypothetical protein
MSWGADNSTDNTYIKVRGEKTKEASDGPAKETHEQ